MFTGNESSLGSKQLLTKWVLLLHAPHRPLESDLSQRSRWTDLCASRLITTLLFSESGSWSNQSQSDAAPRSISLFLPFSHYHSVSTRSSSSPFSCWLSWGVFPHLFMWHTLIINETEVSKEALEWWWCRAKDRPGSLGICGPPWWRTGE